jgi:hypothetical protein
VSAPTRRWTVSGAAAWLVDTLGPLLITVAVLVTMFALMGVFR